MNWIKVDSGGHRPQRLTDAFHPPRRRRSESGGAGHALDGAAGNTRQVSGHGAGIEGKDAAEQRGKPQQATGLRVIGGLLLVVGAVAGWWRFSRSDDPAEGVPPDAGHGSAAAATAKFPEDARAKHPRHKTSGRSAGRDSVARYFGADEAGRRAIIGEWADRAGNGSSPDDAVQRLAEPP